MWVLRFLTFLTFCISSYAHACEKVIRVIEFAPYSMKINEQWQGLHVDLSKELVGALNCTPKYIEFPFARAMELLKSGQIDMVFQLTRTEDREPYIHFVGPIHVERIVLVAHKSVETPIYSLQQIASLKKLFGVQRGVYMGPVFNDLFSRDEIFRSKFRILTEIDPLVTMVNKDRLDGFFIEQIHFQYMKKTNLDYIEVNQQPAEVYETPVYVGLSKKSFSRSDVEKVVNAFNEIKETGMLTNLQRHYLANNLKQNL